jgi:hypothetical protein
MLYLIAVYGRRIIVEVAVLQKYNGMSTIQPRAVRRMVIRPPQDGGGYGIPPHEVWEYGNGPPQDGGGHPYEGGSLGCIPDRGRECGCEPAAATVAASF